MDVNETVERLRAYRALLTQWHSGARDTQLRAEINHSKKWVQQQIIEARCFKVFTIEPPRTRGGLVMQNINPFDMLFDPPYHHDFIGPVIDMVDETIGAFLSGAVPQRTEALRMQVEVRESFAFVAMPMPKGDAKFDDVLDAIKEAAKRCGISRRTNR